MLFIHNIGYCRHVEPLVPALEAAAKDLARNFKDPAKKSKAEGVLEQINRHMDAIANALNSPSADEAAIASDNASVELDDSINKQVQKVRYEHHTLRNIHITHTCNTHSQHSYPQHIAAMLIPTHIAT